MIKETIVYRSATSIETPLTQLDKKNFRASGCSRQKIRDGDSGNL